MLDTICGTTNSSVSTDAIDTPVFDNVLQFARERAEENPWWFKLYGQHQRHMLDGQKLSVIEMQAGAPDKTQQRNKLLLSMVDLNQKLKDEITADVNQFFHHSTPAWYQDTGRPYRHGYLLYGPPGTGKTSLSTALASHCNIPLVIISLRSMDDNQLKQGFYNRAARATDINSNRTRDNPSDASTIVPGGDRASAFESTMNRFMDEQNVANHRVLSRVTTMEDRLAGYIGRDPVGDHVARPRSNGEANSITPISASSSVSLSGLLNVIDGANATEGRLIIMTTNHLEMLDPALYRSGRIDCKVELGFANKETSLLTFKRLFDNDVLKRYTTDAINRFAKAFQDQFPSYSKVTTAELAKYFGQYRGRPDKAVEDFADWFKLGDDRFTGPMDYTHSSDEDGVYNVPEPFDRALLQVSASDFVDSTAPVAKSSTPKVEAASSVWNTLSWKQCSAKETLARLRTKWLATTSNFSDQRKWISLLKRMNQAHAP
ncbi:Nn.00g005200.m01.CDS01 [Neocucurbitaria sp. VM-36]